MQVRLRLLLIIILSSIIVGCTHSNNSIKDYLISGRDAYQHGDYSEAQHDYEQALLNSRKNGDKIGEASSLNNLGTIANVHGDYKQAKAYFERTLALHIASNNNEIEKARTLNNLGSACIMLEDFAQAKEYIEEATVLNKKYNIPTQEAWGLNNLGLIFQNSGQDAKALAYFDQSLEVSKKNGFKDREASTQNNLGVLFIYIGDLDKAKYSLDQSLQIAKSLGDKSKEANALTNLSGISSAEGDVEQALKYDLQALDINRTINRKDHQQINLANIGLILIKQGKFDEAKKYFIELEEPFKSGGLALYDLHTNNFSEAHTLWANLLSIDKSLHGSSRIVAEYFGLGMASEGLRNWKESYSHFHKVVDMIEAERAQLDTPNRRQFLTGEIFFFNRMEPYEGLARVALADGDASNGLFWSENTKSRLFLEALANKQSDNGFSLPADLTQQEHEVNTRLRSLYHQQESAFNSKNTELFQKIEVEIAEAKRAQEAFVSRLRRDYPSYAAVAYPQPLHLEEIKLNPNEVLLEYEVTETATLGWLVRDGKVVKTLNWPVSRKALNDRVKQFHENLSRPGQFEELARGLYRDLVAPFTAELKPSDQVIIVPDDALATIPFEALVMDQSSGSAPENAGTATGEQRGLDRLQGGLASTPGGLRYFGDAFKLRYAQSATALVQTRQFRQSAKAEGKPLLVVADPVFDVSDARLRSTQTLQVAYAGLAQTAIRRQLAKRDGKAVFDRLPSTDESAGRLAAMFGGPGRTDVLKGLDANEETVKQKLGQGYRYAIFATHGILANDLPYLQEPALVLSLVSRSGTHLPSENEGSPGFLTLTEVMGLKIDSDLVALTACNTGMGLDLLGEGAMSMGRGFQYAGVESVLMSLWSVYDDSTNILTEKFFAHLREGKGKLEALRQARAEVRSDSRYSHPYYWAPFILVGEP